MAQIMSDDSDDALAIKQEEFYSQPLSDDANENPSSPRSRSPSLKEEVVKSEEGSPSRKRSYQELDVNDEDENIHESSTTIVDGIQRSSPETHSDRNDADKAPTSRAQAMLPPPIPVHSKHSTSTGATRDVVKPQQSYASESLTHGATQIEGTCAKPVSNSDETSTLEPPDIDDPEQEIDKFDWEDIQVRYQSRMTELNVEENSILSDFNDLCNYFGIWAQAGSHREIERSFKRMKTQMTLDQYHEEELEQKHVKVVEAFKNALQLMAD